MFKIMWLAIWLIIVALAKGLRRVRVATKWATLRVLAHLATWTAHVLGHPVDYPNALLWVSTGRARAPGGAEDTTMLGNLIDIIQGFPTVDLDTAGANADWIGMTNFSSIIVLFESGVGTGGEDAALDFEQAVDNSGGSGKALNLPTTASTRVWKKQAATSLASVKSWSDGSGDVTTAQLTHADGAEQSQMYAVEIVPSDLDVANGFDFIRVTIDDDFSNTQPGCLHYIGRVMYPSAPDQVQDVV